MTGRSKARSSSAVRAALAVAGALSWSACLLGELDGVPCDDDGQCPTGYFCDVPASQCLAERDDRGPPALTLAGVRQDGEVGRVAFVDETVEEEVALVLDNAGAGAADGVTLEITPVSCVTLDHDPLPQSVPALSSADVPVVVTARLGCGAPITMDWLLRYSGRGSRGTFEVTFRR